jgi:hypothetical protein
LTDHQIGASDRIALLLLCLAVGIFVNLMRLSSILPFIRWTAAVVLEGLR